MCILRMLQHMNPRGESCCAYHVGLATLLHTLQEMIAQECLPDFAPLSGWQCEECLSLNGEEALACEICGSIPHQRPHEKLDHGQFDRLMHGDGSCGEFYSDGEGEEGHTGSGFGGDSGGTGTPTEESSWRLCRPTPQRPISAALLLQDLEELAAAELAALASPPQQRPTPPVRPAVPLPSPSVLHLATASAPPLLHHPQPRRPSTSSGHEDLPSTAASSHYTSVSSRLSSDAGAPQSRKSSLQSDEETAQPASAAAAAAAAFAASAAATATTSFARAADRGASVCCPQAEERHGC